MAWNPHSRNNTGRPEVVPQDRLIGSARRYELKVEQQPIRARMCGFGVIGCALCSVTFNSYLLALQSAILRNYFWATGIISAVRIPGHFGVYKGTIV
ncbi:Velvet factor [Pyrenophora tritici-repentis]|nr:Velvet factor [Pyrenophora tritici-repentis]